MPRVEQMKPFQISKLLAWVLVICISSRAAQEQPNTILIFTDDQGYGDLSCFGAAFR
jgi:hypothetical protein